MNKYYKAEDVINKVAEYISIDYPTEERAREDAELLFADLPTIEVSEDCISREWVLEEFEKGRKTISKSEYFDEFIWLVLHASSVVPKVPSEDCISRATLIKRWDEMSVRGRTEFDQEIMVAPSVIPKPKEGEWLTKTVKKFCAPDCWYPRIFAIEGSWDEEEGSWLEEQDGFCSECGKQDEHYGVHKYCPNCGAEMKGTDDE